MLSVIISNGVCGAYANTSLTSLECLPPASAIASESSTSLTFSILEGLSEVTVYIGSLVGISIASEAREDLDALSNLCFFSPS